MRRRKESVALESKPAPNGHQLVEAIRARAYELYLERGCEPGGELEDWVKAEREVCGRLGVGCAGKEG